MRKLLIIVGVIVLIFAGIYYSRADYRAFDAQRENWKRRCLAYVGRDATINDPAKTKACNEELSEMMAYAKRKGWLE